MLSWSIILVGMLVGTVLAMFGVQADGNARYNKMFDAAKSSRQVSSKDQFEKEYSRRAEGLLRPAVLSLLASVFIWSCWAGALSTSVLGISNPEQYDVRASNFTLGLLIAWFSWIGAWRFALNLFDVVFQQVTTHKSHFAALVWALVIPSTLAAILIIRLVQGEVLFENLVAAHFPYPDILQTIDSLLKSFDVIKWLVSIPTVHGLLVLGLSVVGFIDLGDDILQWIEMMMAALNGTQFRIQRTLRLLKAYDDKTDKTDAASAEIAWQLIVWDQRVLPRLLDYSV